METKQAQPVMFCHDSTSIFYPTAPGRVYIIGILALADCDGSDEDYSDSTATGDLADMMAAGNAHGCSLKSISEAPEEWPGVDLYTVAEVNQDWSDALESWADWCDRDSVRLDSFDEVMGAIVRAA